MNTTKNSLEGELDPRAGSNPAKAVSNFSPDNPTWHRVLKHEYQHYMQSAVLTPIGFSLAYLFDEHILGHNYNENWFELDAERVERDDYKIDIFFGTQKRYCT